MRFAITERSGSPRQPPAGFYRIPIPGKPLFLKINTSLVDRLETAALEGLWAVPKRGAEVGGILIGKIVAGLEKTIVLEDSEPVQCEHRRGPSYLLSEGDRRRLEDTIARARTRPDRRVVGYYRSHTRDNFSLDDEDTEIFSTYFGDPDSVFLLIRPSATKVSSAGVFLWGEGRLRRDTCYLQLPFSLKEMLKNGPGRLESGKAEEQAPASARSQAGPARPPLRARLLPNRVNSPRLWMSLAAVLALIIALLEYRTLQILHAQSALASGKDSGSLALRVEKSGEYLHVNWNRAAAAIVNARRATLSITDGPYRKELALGPDDLRRGSVAYAPSTGDVDFRLELRTSESRTVAESVRVLNSAPGRVQTNLASGGVNGTVRPARPAAGKVGASQRARPTRREKVRPHARFADDGL